ncbi:MAG: hypothetical protein IKH33_05700, partial [Bacteroidales bacterium]|nr:hypothetical protein [Bacteroidales bacterium]
RRADVRVVQDSVSPSLNDIALLGIIDQSYNQRDLHEHLSLLQIDAAVQQGNRRDTRQPNEV